MSRLEICGASTKAWSILSTTTSWDVLRCVYSLPIWRSSNEITCLGIVALKHMICSSCGIWLQIHSTSSKNPISSILSTSSKMRYFTSSSLRIFLSIRSIALPGVHTATCIPWSSNFCWNPILLPPYAASALIRVCLPRLKNSSCVWTASSLVGSSTTAWIFLICACKELSIGNTKAAVLPVPVCDCATMWFLLRNAWITCSWIGVACS